MKINFKGTPEQIELVKRMASANRLESEEAKYAFAAFVSGVIQTVLSKAGTASLIYSDLPFNEDDSPSFPLDLYFGKQVGEITVTSQNIAGGLPSNHLSGMQEMKFTTYRLDSAIDMLVRYIKRARLDVVAAGIERMTQEILVKQERNAWAVIMKALAEATTNSQQHVFKTSTDAILKVHDLNLLFTRAKRINAAFDGGTPDNFSSRGVTDLFVSPEVVGYLREMAYNPMNTRVVEGTAGTPAGSSTAMPLDDATRNKIFNTAGIPEIYGLGIHELNELGVNQKYNTLFSTFRTTNITQFDGTDSEAFVTTTDEIIVGADLSRERFALRPVAQQAESGGSVVVLPDDQYVARQGKAGFYSFVEEGRVIIDDRPLTGLAIYAA